MKELKKILETIAKEKSDRNKLRANSNYPDVQKLHAMVNGEIGLAMAIIAYMEDKPAILNSYLNHSTSITEES